MDIKVLGIDLGKTICSLAGLDAAGAVVFRKRIQRHRLLDFLDGLLPCVVAMEACGGAHHIGRLCLQNGHEPRLMSPLYVRPYVKVHKKDDCDAEAISEAAMRPTMSFVAIKTDEQLDLQALHRARERLVSDRTRLINQGRGFLMERGIRVGVGRHVFQKELTKLTAEGSGDLSHRMLLLLSDMVSELDVINDRIAAIDAEVKALAKADADMQRLMEIPGVGPTIATALVAAVGTGTSFGKGRDLAAWLGLVPRQITTGGKAKLIGISKHGNRYLRKLFIHGARTVLHLVRDRTSPIAAWADGLKERAHVNVAAVVLQFQHIPGLLSYPCQKIPVMALAGDFVGDDQMGLGIDNALDIIANMPAVLRAGCHGTRVGIGQGYLTVRRIVQGLLHCQKPFDLAPDAMITTGQMGGTFCHDLAGFLAVDPFGFLDIASDLGFQMRKAAGDLLLAEVTVPVVDCLELGSPSTATVLPFSTPIRRQS